MLDTPIFGENMFLESFIRDTFIKLNKLKNHSAFADACAYYTHYKKSITCIINIILPMTVLSINIIINIIIIIRLILPIIVPNINIIISIIYILRIWLPMHNNMHHKRNKGHSAYNCA